MKLSAEPAALTIGTFDGRQYRDHRSMSVKRTFSIFVLARVAWSRTDVDAGLDAAKIIAASPDLSNVVDAVATCCFFSRTTRPLLLPGQHPQYSTPIVSGRRFWTPIAMLIAWLTALALARGLCMAALSTYADELVLFRPPPSPIGRGDLGSRFYPQTRSGPRIEGGFES